MGFFSVMDSLYRDYPLNLELSTEIYQTLHGQLEWAFIRILWVFKLRGNVCHSIRIHYCILRGRVKGFNRSIITILFEVGTVIELRLGSYRMLE